MREGLLHLKVAHIQGSVARMDWSLAEEGLGKLVQDQVVFPQILLVTATRTRQGNGKLRLEEKRYVMPLCQKSLSMRFGEPGTHTVYGFVVSNKSGDVERLRRIIEDEEDSLIERFSQHNSLKKGHLDYDYVYISEMTAKTEVYIPLAPFDLPDWRRKSPQLAWLADFICGAWAGLVARQPGGRKAVKTAEEAGALHS